MVPVSLTTYIYASHSQSALNKRDLLFKHMITINSIDKNLLKGDYSGKKSSNFKGCKLP